MRIASAATAAIMALAALTAPVLAKNSETQKAEDKSAASSCSAYQQADDGSWIQLPCKETGERNNQTQTQHRSPTQAGDQH
ncbi:hypothetical protein JQ596_21530 [Bradyrhizobium manausense]|uniref:hypothetical protein n=1 Tax=Bradyrhizobium TaxID=374 RepID=UPI001BAB8251|nr:MULTISPECIES: hypothetical protein [Bradyrhizobium]MBR0828121.1 hypothetical protein [Bradyrhizobium manausense]UVO32977.1 hypothetical protein KUF59_21335 [Bradyrhizobium arachidis]